MLFSLDCSCKMIRAEEWRRSQNNDIHTCINYFLICIKSNKAVFNRNILTFLILNGLPAGINTILKCVAKGNDLQVWSCTQKINSSTWYRGHRSL